MRLIRSATFKLTLWYLAIIMMLSGLFSLALYRVSFDQLVENTERQRLAVARLPLPLVLEARRTEFTQALTQQLEDSQNHLFARLAVLNLAMLLLGGAASYFLARRTLRPIQDSLEAQGRFTADASHELRTPLTAMRTEIEVALREQELSSVQARELLSSNLEEIAKLEALSAGLLRLARFENGLDPAAVSHVPVGDLFEAAIDRFQTKLAEHNIQLNVHHGSEVVAGDRDSLVELVVVLLDNAIKYSPPGSPVTLSSKSTGGFVYLSVADLGAGIASADMPHIFDRFYRADRSRSKQNVHGYGLGLSIAKRVVLLHRGTIAIDSTPGKGTTFKVKLPVHYTHRKSLFS